jgi:hypothetical protein
VLTLYLEKKVVGELGLPRFEERWVYLYVTVAFLIVEANPTVDDPYWYQPCRTHTHTSPFLWELPACGISYTFSKMKPTDSIDTI